MRSLHVTHPMTGATVCPCSELSAYLQCGLLLCYSCMHGFMLFMYMTSLRVHDVCKDVY
jgi:hypothetical protein